MFLKHYLRKKKNLKVAFKCIQKKYDDALDILSTMQPYYMIDKSDLYTLKLLSYVSKKCNRDLESSIYRNSYCFFSNNEGLKTKRIKKIEQDGVTLYKSFIFSNEISDSLLNAIIAECLSLLKTTEAAVFLCLLRKNNGCLNNEIESTITKKYYHVFSFAEDLMSKNDLKCIVIDDIDEDKTNYRCISLCKALALLGFNVTFVFKEKDNYNELSYDLNINLICYLDDYENKVFTLLREVATEPHASYLFVEVDFLENLYEKSDLYQITQMYHRNPADFPYRRMNCLLLGDFYKIKSVLYKQDVYKLVIDEPKVDFSIVIPARNSSVYLRYAIETCLNQNYSGTYEILISDNSAKNNNEVLQLIQQLNNPLIRYIRAPFALSLAQSFEYAYLNARGDKILSIGSDDGLVNNALTVLDGVFAQYPQNDIVHFEGTFYQWPEHEHEGYLTIDNNAINKKDIKIIDCAQQLNQVLKDYVSFTEMPILYMHTCIRKRYIQKIIFKTGKFEYGESQDIYTGLINLINEDKIIYISHPLLIGGSSGIGVGNRVRDRIARGELTPRDSSFRYRDFYSKRFRKYETVGLISDKEHYFIMREYEKIMGMKVFDKEILSDDDYLDAFENIYSCYPLNAVDINLLKNQLKKIAHNRSKEFYSRYIENRTTWEKRRSEREKKEKRDKRIVHARSAIQKNYFGQIIYANYRKIRRRRVNDKDVYDTNEENNTLTIVKLYNEKKIDNVYVASECLSKMINRNQ